MVNLMVGIMVVIITRDGRSVVSYTIANENNMISIEICTLVSI